MGGVSGLLGLVLAVFGLIIMVTAAAAIAKSSYATEQLKGLRGDRDDLQARVAILEAENTRKTAELEAAEVKILALQKIVIGKEQLDRIETIVTRIEAAQKQAGS